MNETIEDIRASVLEIMGEAHEVHVLSYTVEKDMQTLKKDNAKLKAQNEKLMELVRDMWRDGMCDCDEQCACDECEYGYHERMRKLGIEVD